MVFIVLVDMAVASDSIGSEEAISFILSTLEREDIILSKHQLDAISNVLNGRDVIVCLPTGHGKSLIFEIVPWCYESVQGCGEEVRDTVFSVLIVSPCRDIEEYVQQSGRGGRDGDQCHALLYTYSGCTRGHVSEEMKEYCTSADTCHRRTLFQYFPGLFVRPSVLHDCCDACQLMCLCCCRCHHCVCGGGSPCFVCCVCSTRCSYLPLFPTVYHESNEEDMNTPDLCWNDKDSIFAESNCTSIHSVT